MRRVVHRLAVAVLVVAAAITLAGCQQQESAAPPTSRQQMPAPVAATSKAAADFTLDSFGGKTIKLSELKGEPVVVNFWSSTCHYCAQEAPILDEIYRQYQGQGLQVLGVGLDDAQALREKAQQLKLTYPTGYNAEAGQEYGVTGVPQTVFIDRHGDVVATLVGARPKAELEAEVKKVL
jgi:cytochrome c biogenesis protein CcmG/thiol:disulfide interchange protein DsbE